MAKSKYDFAAWLETKDPNKEYAFSDGCGECLMGQFMASQGALWSFPLYQEYVNDVLGEQYGVTILSSSPQTFGGARARVKEFTDA